MKTIGTLFALTLLISSLPANADTYSTGNITALRTTSNSTLHAEGQRGMIIWQLDTSLHQNCTWLGITKDNPYFISTLLSAEARNEQVRVWYDEVNRTGIICWAHTIELNTP